MPALLELLKGTPLHPQWLSVRFHRASRRSLREIEDGDVLDIGSGNTDHRSLVGPRCSLYRLDYPATNARYQERPHVYGDAGRLPIAATTMDAVLLLEVLEHLPSDVAAVAEIWRVLKPGGRLYISVPFIYPVHDAPWDFRRYTIFGLKHLLSNHGFEIVRERWHGNSFVTAMQLLNLALLEVARDIHLRNRILGWVVAAVLYPMTLAVNAVASPFLALRRTRASCFGYFVTAARR